MLIPSSHSKSGDVIEPVLKPQWWVNCKPLAEEALEVSCYVKLTHSRPYKALEDQSWRTDNIPQNL